MRQGSSRGCAETAPRVPVSESELNSWFTYAAKPLLPPGVTDPRVTMVGNGKLTGQATVDLNFNKSVELAGKRQVQLRLEAFNLFNRPNFGVPSGTIFNPDGSYNANAGRITSTKTAGRQIQLGAKFIW